MTETVSPLMKYLAFVRDARLEMAGERYTGLVYCCMEDLVLQHGRAFTPQPLPQKFQRMTPSHCFDNAYRLCRRYHTTLRYVEGFADKIIPMHHAWTIDRENRVVDPTWDPVGTEYFGIVIPLDRVKAVRFKDHCSVLDDYPRGFRILKEPWKENA